MKTNNVMTKISVLVIGAITGSFVVTNDASAKWIRDSAAVCVYDTVNSGFGYPKFINNAWTNGDNNDDMKFNCPISNTSWMPQDTIETIRIHVYDGHDSDRVWAKVCIQDYDSSTAWCGSYDSTSDPNVYWDVLEPSLAYLNASYSQFGYIYIQLPDEDDGLSRLTGMYYYD